jgi:hypothetical protein
MAVAYRSVPSGTGLDSAGFVLGLDDVRCQLVPLERVAELGAQECAHLSSCDTVVPRLSGVASALHPRIFDPAVDREAFVVRHRMKVATQVCADRVDFAGDRVATRPSSRCSIKLAQDAESATVAQHATSQRL